MATTARGYTFEELEGSPEVDGGMDGVRAKREFKVAWADWQNFVAELKGSYVDTAGTVSATQPLPFPGSGFDNLRVDSWSIKPFEPSKPVGTEVTHLTSGVNSYDNGARVTVIYKTEGNGDAGMGGGTVSKPEGTYFTYESDLGAEYMTVPNRTWQWDTLNEQLAQDVPVAILQPTGTHHITWHNVSRPPWSAIKARRGKVNLGTFSGFANGILLFAGARIRSILQLTTTLFLYDLEYTFLEKDQDGANSYGWNYFYNSKRSGGTHWQRIEATDGGEYPFLHADFESLFAYG